MCLMFDVTNWLSHSIMEREILEVLFNEIIEDKRAVVELEVVLVNSFSIL